MYGGCTSLQMIGHIVQACTLNDCPIHRTPGVMMGVCFKSFALGHVMTMCTEGSPSAKCRPWHLPGPGTYRCASASAAAQCPAESRLRLPAGLKLPLAPGCALSVSCIAHNQAHEGNTHFRGPAEPVCQRWVIGVIPHGTHCSQIVFMLNY